MTINSQRKAPFWLLTLVWAYLALLASLTLLNRVGADIWWLGAFNLYLPQSVWALPGVLLGALSFKLARRLTWLPLLGVVWVAGPLMGFCWPMQSPGKRPNQVPLRVMTWNVKYGTREKLTPVLLKYNIDCNNPAVVLLQDAGGLLEGPLGEYFKDWQVRSHGEYIIASRLPLGELQLRRISFRGSDQFCLRTQLQVGSTQVALYNVHFESPRYGLLGLRVVKREPWSLPSAIRHFENNVKERFSEVRILSENIRQERGPVILAGDLNSPDSSTVCMTLRTIDLHDAFAQAGKGYGYTYGHFLLERKLPLINMSWMRIDHIMMTPQIQSRRCWTGTDMASDHRPVIADLMVDQR